MVFLHTPNSIDFILNEVLFNSVCSTATLWITSFLEYLTYPLFLLAMDLPFAMRYPYELYLSLLSHEPMKTKVHKISKFFIRKSAFLFLAKFYGHFSKCYNEVPYLLRHRCCRLWNYHQQNIGTRRFDCWRTNSSLGMVEDRTLDRRNWSSLIS